MENIKKPKSQIEIPKTEHSQSNNQSLQKYMIISGLIISAIVLVGGFAIFWLGSRYTYQSNENKAQDQLIASLEQKQKDLQALKPNLDAITSIGANGVSDADLILRAVPTTQNFESLIAVLERIGAESGIKVTNISQSSNGATSSTGTVNTNVQGSSGQATPYTFTVNVEGSYAGILEFMKKTEKSARVINFNNMNINGSTGNITANMTMTTFFKPPANINSTFVPLN